jgi:hypothetical protein
MKRILLFLSCCGLLGYAAELGSVRNVYVLPMSHGLDQYLANRLTNEHIFQIVTDAKLADAVLTDRVGEGLKSRLEELIPPPVPEKPEKTEKTDEQNEPKNLLDTANKLSNPANSSSVGHSKGTVFLVDTKSREVVWSVYNLPKNSSSKELDRIASDIVSRIKKDLNPPKK